MDFIEEYYFLWCGFLGLFIAQVLKPFIGILKTKKFDLSLVVASGGFPSSHTAAVVSTTTAIGIVEGTTSAVFAIGVIFSLVIMYDAMNVRYYAGKNIQLTQQIIKDLIANEFKLDNPIYINNLKEILGHERLEVFGGFILGVAIPFLVFWLFNS